MIYFVEEDVPYAKEFSVPLILRGYDVEILPDADTALARLDRATDIELVVIDIMLATRDAVNSQFKPDETDGFLLTGLNLMFHLSAKRGDIFPRRFVVLTAASELTISNRLVGVCRNMRVPILRKGDYRRPKLLADELIYIMQRELRYD